jgi:predicted small secreted protein
MKNHLLRLRLTPFLFLLALVVFCAGCETLKGMGRDIKNADEWIRDRVV